MKDDWALLIVVAACMLVLGYGFGRLSSQADRDAEYERGFQAAVEAYYRNVQADTYNWHGLGRRPYDSVWIAFMRHYCDLIKADAPPPIMPYLPDTLSFPYRVSALPCTLIFFKAVTDSAISEEGESDGKEKRER